MDANSPVDLIPAAHRDPVVAAVQATFGSRVTAASRVMGGASASIFRIDVDGAPYLLRIDRARDPFRDPERTHGCMRIAADAGITPALHYADAASGIAITDFVIARPITEFPGGPVEVARSLGMLVAKLQAAPLFPVLWEFPALLRRLLGYIRNSDLFTPGLLDAHAEGLERIVTTYPWDPAATVSSHNDPNPRNILFDGQRLWLVDWETAFRNDPLADVAMLIEHVASTPDMERALLAGWLTREPDRELLARLALMRPLTRLYYACIILAGVAAAPRYGPPDASLAALTGEEIHRAVTEGRLKDMPDILYALGKMFLATFLQGLDTPAFRDAMSVLGRA